MTEITVWRYFATSITLPLVIPIVFLLISTWRFPPKRMNRIFLEIEGGMVGLGLLIYLLLGPTVISAWIAGTLLPVICTIAFLACCELRDGRLAFILVTAGLDTSICDALTTVFVQRDHFLWILLKVLITVLQTLLIWKFCRKPLLEMLDENQIKWGQVVWVPLFLWISLVAFCVYPAVAESRRAPVFPTLVLCITTVLLYVMLYRFQRAIRQQAEIQKYNAILRSEVGFLERRQPRLRPPPRASGSSGTTCATLSGCCAAALLVETWGMPEKFWIGWRKTRPLSAGWGSCTAIPGTLFSTRCSRRPPPGRNRQESGLL